MTTDQMIQKMKDKRNFKDITLARYTAFVSEISKVKKLLNDEIVLLQNKQVSNVSAKRYIQLKMLLATLQKELNYSILTLQYINKMV